jgi:hypothetical protein
MKDEKERKKQINMEIMWKMEKSTDKWRIKMVNQDSPNAP